MSFAEKFKEPKGVTYNSAYLYLMHSAGREREKREREGGRERERETHTHTHTHRVRDRERKRARTHVCPGERPASCSSSYGYATRFRYDPSVQLGL